MSDKLQLDVLGDMRRTHTCNQLGAEDVGREVVLAGWALRRRDHGGVIFVDLRDREGITQVVFNPEVDENGPSEGPRNSKRVCPVRSRQG